MFCNSFAKMWCLISSVSYHLQVPLVRLAYANENPVKLDLNRALKIIKSSMMLVFVFCSWSFAKAARHYSTQGRTERVDLNLRIKRNSCDEKAVGFGALSCCSLVPQAFCPCPVP